MTNPDREMIRRAIDRAALAASKKFVEALQDEMRGLAAERGEAPTFSEFAGTHLHEAVILDDRGEAVVLRCIRQIVTTPEEVRDVIDRASVTRGT